MVFTGRSTSDIEQRPVDQNPARQFQRQYLP